MPSHELPPSHHAHVCSHVCSAHSPLATCCHVLPTVSPIKWMEWRFLSQHGSKRLRPKTNCLFLNKGNITSIHLLKGPHAFSCLRLQYSFSPRPHAKLQLVVQGAPFFNDMRGFPQHLRQLVRFVQFTEEGELKFILHCPDQVESNGLGDRVPDVSHGDLKVGIQPLSNLRDEGTTLAKMAEINGRLESLGLSWPAILVISACVNLFLDNIFHTPGEKNILGKIPQPIKRATVSGLSSLLGLILFEH